MLRHGHVRTVVQTKAIIWLYLLWIMLIQIILKSYQTPSISDKDMIAK